MSHVQSAPQARFSRSFPEGTVLFFDGVCGLCDGTISFLIDHDRKKVLKFSPLQSEFARKELPPVWTDDLQSMVLKENGEVYTKSDAVLRVFEYLGGMWFCFAKLARLLPRALRDPLYQFIARHRYLVFGRKSECRIPTPTERVRFIF